MAKEVGRVVVSGHAATVGIVGWTLGGGHGQLAPLFGLGVDQVFVYPVIIRSSYALYFMFIRSLSGGYILSMM